MNFYFIRAASRNWRVMCSASVSMWHCGLVFSGCMHSLPSSSLRSFLWFFSSMIRLCHHNLGCTSKFKHPQKINWNCINSKFLLTAFVLKSVLSDIVLLASLVAQRVKRLPAMQETRVWSLSGEDPLEKEMSTHSSALAWKIPWTEKPGVGYRPWGSRELNTALLSLWCSFHLSHDFHLWEVRAPVLWLSVCKCL